VHALSYLRSRCTGQRLEDAGEIIPRSFHLYFCGLSEDYGERFGSLDFHSDVPSCGPEVN
jgi:hypothetical protein